MRRALTASLAAATIAAAATAPAAMAGTSGAACTAWGYSYGSAVDSMSFYWTLGSSLQRTGTARLQVAPSGASVYSTISAVSVRRSGSRTLYGSVASPSYLPAGRYAWRVEVTEWDGTAFTCDGSSPFEVTRLPAPSVSLSGSGITADGWRVVSSGQYVGVAPAPGDPRGGTGLVRFQYASGAWSSYRSAPAPIPSTDIVAVQAVRQSDTYMSGPAVTLPLRTDSSAPATPRPRAESVDVGPSGAEVGFAPSSDTGSGTATYEALVVTGAGAKGSWQLVSGLAARAGAGSGGGTMLLRACDRVGNCSASAEVRLNDGGDAVDGTPDQDTATPGRSSARRASPAALRARHAPMPRITALVPESPGGGAGRVTVELNRASEVTFSFGGATIARAWLGAGRTLVRLPAQSRARRGVLTAHPRAGSARGEAVTASVSLPGGARKGSMSLRTTRLRAGATAVLYDMDPAVREIVSPLDGSVGLTEAHGALRQEPSGSGLFSARDDNARIGKVTEEDIHPLSADEIAALLREAIDDAEGHQVAFDELTSYMADPRSPFVRNGRIPPPDPASPGAQLAQALIALDTPSPYGGTWASRVHVYIAPAVVGSIAAGRGPDRNLGRDRKARFRTYRTVMTGLARAGAVWIEAYHGGSRPYPSLTVEEWRRAPAAFTAEYRRAGGDPSKLHLLMTGSVYPKGKLPAACVTPMACQWALAESTSAGRKMLSNGVGAYRLGSQARPWLAEWQRRMS